MKHIRKVLAIALLAAVIGIVTGGQAMADKDSAPGHNKIDICHYNEDGEYKKKTIPQKAVDSHLKNHENDLVLTSGEECPDAVDEESESGDSMDMLLGMFTQIVTFDQEVDNLQNQIDTMNGAGNENFIFRHVTDSGEGEWNPNGSTKNFLITDEGINTNSVVSITIILPIGTDSGDTINCIERLIEMSDGSYVLGISCSSDIPEETQLNYVIMNPTI